MIWNDAMIVQWAEDGGVTPFNPALINPASLDLRLGNMLRIPDRLWSRLSAIDMYQHIENGTIDDLPKWSEPIEFETYWLMPQGKGPSFCLCSSLEFINMPNDMAVLLFSKSSTGRRGLEHLHAGFGDPGWYSSQWTWELHNVAPWPIKLVAGQPLMQQVMIRMTDEPLRTYAEVGRYNNQVGPTPEREAQ